MITLFTGMPGAGKTAAMIDLLRQLAKDRPVFVHFDPSERLRPEQKLLHETLQLPHQPVLASNWHNEVPDGGILVIDEAQGCWRPRGPAAKVPEAIAALETHRHSGVDIFITTQAPRLIDSNVRGLVGRHVHIRDTGWLGRWWYEWPETNEGVAWKSCPVKKRYTLPKQVFDLYTSANEHHKPVRATPKTVFLVAFLLLCLGALIWMLVRSISSHTAPAKPDQAPPANTAPAIQPGTQARTHGPDAAPLADERVDFIPRLSDRPWTAPAYDHLRKVVRLPVITGAICINTACTCYNGREKLMDVASEQCHQWARDRPFNPYVASGDADNPSANTPSAKGQTEPVHGAS